MKVFPEKTLKIIHFDCLLLKKYKKSFVYIVGFEEKNLKLFVLIVTTFAQVHCVAKAPLSIHKNGFDSDRQSHEELMVILKCFCNIFLGVKIYDRIDFTRVFMRLLSKLQDDMTYFKICHFFFQLTAFRFYQNCLE